ncbi:MAG TPA: dTMP kinase [Deltaproteobacteria bacterium]|nr:dTMP kinase [Deltaproteobacteria bacterium]
MIISFEGGEGVGKSSHCARLCSALDNKKLPWLTFREPGGSFLSEKIRPLFMSEGIDTMTELLLVLASRRQNIFEIINPALDKGKIIIIDRFIDSTLVYQGIAGNLGLSEVKNIMKSCGTWIEPDITFILDIEPAKAFKRFIPGDKFENRDDGYHRKIRQAFLDIATDKRHRIINADRDRNEVSREIISIAEKIITENSM